MLLPLGGGGCVGSGVAVGLGGWVGRGVDVGGGWVVGRGVGGGNEPPVFHDVMNEL